MVGIGDRDRDEEDRVGDGGAREGAKIGWLMLFMTPGLNICVVMYNGEGGGGERMGGRGWGGRCREGQRLVG